MREWWSTRWYIPIIGLAALLLALLVGGLVVMEMFAAATPSVVAPRAWATPLDRVDAALERGDTTAALSAWREAHAAAMRSGQWEGMIAVGDASRRVGERSGAPRDGVIRARTAYLTALLLARRERSVEGSLRAAVAFGELGDREVLTQALRIAEQQAGRDAAARARVRAVADRWIDPATHGVTRRDLNHTGRQEP